MTINPVVLILESNNYFCLVIIVVYIPEFPKIYYQSLARRLSFMFQTDKILSRCESSYYALIGRHKMIFSSLFSLQSKMSSTDIPIYRIYFVTTNHSIRIHSDKQLDHEVILTENYWNTRQNAIAYLRRTFSRIDSRTIPHKIVRAIAECLEDNFENCLDDSFI